MIKRLLCILIPCLLFVISCAKDTSEDESSVYVSPPFNNSNTESPSTSVTQFTLTVSAGEGEVFRLQEVHIMMEHQLV